MNIICTISSKNYLKYTHRLIYSIRDTGWDGKIVVLSCDDIYCNCEVKKIKEHFKTDLIQDSRWVQFDLMDYFEDGDKIMYLDSDMLCLKKCDLNELFEYELLCSVVYHDKKVGAELPKLSEILKREIDFKYIQSPFVCEVNEKTRSFFDLCKITSYVSEALKFGSLFAFNLAAHRCVEFDPDIFPRNKVIYTVDMMSGKRYRSPWFVHYGGKKGFELWLREYL